MTTRELRAQLGLARGTPRALLHVFETLPPEGTSPATSPVRPTPVLSPGAQRPPAVPLLPDPDRLDVHDPWAAAAAGPNLGPVEPPPSTPVAREPGKNLDPAPELGWLTT